MSCITIDAVMYGPTPSITIESVEKPLAGGATFTYTSENDRPVGACPVPPPPPAPPAIPALQGSIFKLAHITIHKLLKSGWLDQVSINQPGTVNDLMTQITAAFQVTKQG